MSRLLIVFNGALLLAALAAEARGQAAPSAAAVEEPSVKPGVNGPYLQPNVDVNQWVERFEGEGREIFVHREQILAAAQIRAGWTVADVGAGTGLFVPMMARAVGPAGKVYAVDIVQGFLEHIAKRCAEAGIENVETVHCTERSVELPPASIDLAFICDVYHHFEYPRSSLASIHRALKPRGELVLVEFKRIPGKSSDWVIGHVRAGQEEFTREIEAAGFERIEQKDFLEDNYFVRFRRID